MAGRMGAALRTLPHRAGGLLVGLLLLLLLPACGGSGDGPGRGDGGVGDDGGAGADRERPNVVLIIADDLGYGDVSCYRPDAPPTPHIDRLAAEGVRFTDFHSSSPVCAPTRLVLMTGRHPQRAGNFIANDWTHMSAGQAAAYEDELQQILPGHLAADGYRTGLVGKWHLGPPKSELVPTRRGFEVFRGYLSGSLDYSNHVNQRGVADWWDGEKRADEEGYLTHLITRHAVDFIDAHADEPFLLVVSHAAPHRPHQAPGDGPVFTPGERYDWPGGATPPETYAALVAELDAGVGAVLAALERHDLDARTLVVFLSDNGATADGHNGPYVGGKGDLAEGGHRVPAILRWPGRLPAGTTSAALASTLDVVPTILEAAGVEAPRRRAPDGMSLLGVAAGDAPDGERSMVWEHVAKDGAVHQSVRRGPWKLLVQGGEARLFHVDRDPGETEDLSQRQPGRVGGMRKELADWKKALAAEYGL